MKDAQEVIALWLVIEDRTLIHLFLHHCDAFEVFSVYLTKQWNLLAFFPKDLNSMLTHVSQALVLSSLDERLDRQGFVRVDVSFHLTSHSKVVNQERVLVFMLENAELSVLE